MEIDPQGLSNKIDDIDAALTVHDAITIALCRSMPEAQRAIYEKALREELEFAKTHWLGVLASEGMLDRMEIHSQRAIAAARLGPMT